MPVNTKKTVESEAKDTLIKVYPEFDTAEEADGLHGTLDDQHLPRTYKQVCNDKSMEMKPTDRQTDGRTDGVIGKFRFQSTIV